GIKHIIPPQSSFAFESHITAWQKVWRGVIFRNHVGNPSAPINTISENPIQIGVAIECLRDCHAL
ncbi:hypothetical protein DRN77_07655, partial [Methanosarcinales archaeon]